MGFDSMKVSVTISTTQENSSIELKEGATVTHLLQTLSYKPHATLVLHNNTPIPSDDLVIDGEEYQIIPVASGG